MCSFSVELYVKLIFCGAIACCGAIAFRGAIAFAFHLLSPTAGEARKPTIICWKLRHTQCSRHWNDRYWERLTDSIDL